MLSGKRVRLMLAASAIALVAACDTAEERAEKHYQNSLELFAAGDVDRGLVELRNVFQLDDAHRDARELFASELMKAGQTQQAYGQYLQLVERYPDEVEARIILAEIALDNRQWEEVERHGQAAMELAPDDERVEIIEVVLAYRAAVEADDASARRDAARTAAELVETSPTSESLVSLLIESNAADGEFDIALGYANQGIEASPDNPSFHLARLGLLEQMGEIDALEERLVELNERFPDETEYQQMMLRYYGVRGEIEKAEEFLRSIVSFEDEDLAEYTGFVQFIRNTRGVDAAIAELDAALAVRSGEPTLTALKATLTFDSGQRDEGIRMLESLLETAEPSDDTRRFKVALARMLLATANEVGARKLVEEVLAEDSNQVDAIKLQAAWMIDDDRSVEAVNMLRRALDEAPQDAELMTLMARAHARNGDTSLARDLLALAAETSGFAPAESARYARALISEEEFATAETTLVSSLRARPNTLATLALLSEIYIRTEDWGRAEQVERNLRRIDTPEAIAAADQVRLAILNQQDRSSDALAFLEQQFSESDGDTRSLSALIQSHLAAGNTAQARNVLDAALSEAPDDDDLKYLDAALHAANGEFDTAETIYRDLLETYPTNERLWMELLRLAGRQGDTEALATIVDEGLTAIPDAPNLLWAKASQLEQDLDIDGAIEIYERLYAQSSNSVVAANNLASLLATYRGEDAESLDRAYRIARRLRGAENPAFQDTYGWIAYLNNDYDEAVTYLEPAARALSGDPIVQYHLGMTYLALERTDEAREQFERALELAGADDPREQFVTARERLAELDAAPDAQ